MGPGTEFIAPAEAPIFRPSEEDFIKGPLEYISKIRPLAEKHGICKIIPPPSFQPPFAVDVEKFRFTPRVQRLNELEAQTRVKLNFLEQIIKYWDLQGAPFKLPTVERKVLDLYSLHKVVAEEGGFETCTRERKWSKVASRMNFNLNPNNKGTISSLLRQHYERILYPFDVFLSGATIGGDLKIPGVKVTHDIKPNVDNSNNNNNNNNGTLNEGTPITVEFEKPKIKTEPVNLESNDGDCLKSTFILDKEGSSHGISNSEESCMSSFKGPSPLPPPSTPTSVPSGPIINKNLKVEKESKQLRTSPRRVGRPITYNLNVDLSRQARLNGRPDGAPNSRISDFNEDETTDCEESKDEEEEEDKHEPIQLRPSPRRLAHRMQTQQGQRRRTSYPRVDKGLFSCPFSELQRLQVYGAGPKMPGFSSQDSSKTKTQDKNGKEITNGKNQICTLCNENTFSHQLLRCAGCDHLFHLYCLIPPLNNMPTGVWHCPRCVASFVQNQPQPFTHEFGFAQSQRDYTLADFGEMADQFKADYFRLPPHMVPLSRVEKEFWRLVSSMDESVTVEYGADLHTNDFGSGFPTKKSKFISPADLEYIDHPWNLNNLPILEGSVFKYINSNISGMIVPWIYVGMCFSTFCWHNEDHWSYSINYLHWGEAKTWYGVPGDAAEKFEDAMKQVAPELFDSQPDLLHQLVTICNPNILMKSDVPIYRTNQQAGEFVVTFPRAYHAGFNQGLNLAEAVNFAPSEWISMGRICVDHYAMLQRYPVFSHDELICRMAFIADELDIAIASATYDDMLEMVKKETHLRSQLDDWGIIQTEQMVFEALADDERQCYYCRTTCYLSSLSCQCKSDKFVCLIHKDKLCKKCTPSQHILKYRHGLEEFPEMMKKLKERINIYDEWIMKVQKVLNGDTEEVVHLAEVQNLSEEAKIQFFPTNTNVYEQLSSLIEDMKEQSKVQRRMLEQAKKRENLSILKRLKVELLGRNSSITNYTNDMSLEGDEMNSMMKTKKLKKAV
ncbi:lysine-specific demethylase 5D-like isoform X3 [Panonychus citri]|uniref:lysine-specific demethylase 5D-like isoform X3 n=1 Tax=Panonychus citri TaxID=50023 RepID=UPI0023073C35|nr:lysine-specific demethylase 5D-like isoform X3 [Panonychus citri]